MYTLLATFFGNMRLLDCISSSTLHFRGWSPSDSSYKCHWWSHARAIQGPLSILAHTSIRAINAQRGSKLGCIQNCLSIKGRSSAI